MLVPRKRRGPRLVAGLLVLGLGASCRPAAGPEPDPLLVFAAASLADALIEVRTAWSGERPGVPVDLSFGGSNDLARQIAAGAPADLFVAADRARLAAAARGGALDLSHSVALLGNDMVVVVPVSEPDPPPVAGARDLLAFERIGLADPEGVPAGVYARRWLEAAGVWETFRARVVPALDVRANLAAVASGSVPAGIVYATDAASSGLAERVRVIHRAVAADGAPAVVYWAAPLSANRGVAGAGGEPRRADDLLEFLTGEVAGEIFLRHGFDHLPTRESRKPGKASGGG